MNLTRLLRPLFAGRVRASHNWAYATEQVQRHQLQWLLQMGASTEIGHRYNFGTMRSYEEYAAMVPQLAYPDIRNDVMRMVSGERDILWPGVTRRFAQSSGTSDGRSKYIPITSDSLKRCHYHGSKD
ncbi:MAG: GH3 auxin-responsive promoter family protein, partial [Muribaculaceae bacterium]|nr:GH3 auxin-responsive promoter family protein [Muribaculaceae bacterium]